MIAQQNVQQLRDALADRYRIEGELGQGGMGTVYLAEREDVAKRVALELVRGELPSTGGGCCASGAVLMPQRHKQVVERLGERRMHEEPGADARLAKDQFQPFVALHAALAAIVRFLHPPVPPPGRRASSTGSGQADQHADQRATGDQKR